MESLTRSLNNELPFSSSVPQFDQYAQHILENSKTLQVAAATSTPTISTLDSATTVTSSEFFKTLGLSLFKTLEIPHWPHSHITTTTTTTKSPAQMDTIMDFAPNAVVIDSSFSAIDELQKQLEYDKFMNEVWIGIVLTLILISLVFCFCSCFLYHQFRTWKRDYQTTVTQTQSQDVESMKLQPDLEDPVPEYTLVSGLPSYEAALELLHKTPQSCLIVYPSVFSVFNKNERTTNDFATTATTTTTSLLQQQQLQQLQQQVAEVTTPLLSATTSTTTATTIQAPAAATVRLTDVIVEKSKPQMSNGITVVTCNEKAPSYEQALLDSQRKNDKC